MSAPLLTKSRFGAAVVAVAAVHFLLAAPPEEGYETAAPEISAGTVELHSAAPPVRVRQLSRRTTTPVLPSASTPRVASVDSRIEDFGLIQAGSAESSSAAVTRSERLGGRLVVADYVVANLRPGAESRLASLGSRVLHRSAYTGQSRVVVPEGFSPDSFAELLERAEMVTEARPDPACFGAKKNKNKNKNAAQDEGDADDAPEVDDAADADDAAPAVDEAFLPENRPLLALQWSHQASGVRDAWQVERRPGYGDVTVAVLDTGIAYEDFDDGAQAYRRASVFDGVSFAAGYDFVNGDAHPNDDHQHGTFMASVIAATDGMLGSAYGATLMPVKVLDDDLSGGEAALIDGIHFAVEQGADVISMSLSFPPGYLPSTELEAAVLTAREAGVVLVAAAGNDGADQVAYPAAFPDVIAVGASVFGADGKLSLASYSNRGAALDVAMPGGSLDDDEDGNGYADGVLGFTFETGEPEQMGFFFFSGTSAASAQVAGVAAMLRARTQLSAAEIRWALHGTGENLNPGQSGNGSKAVPYHRVAAVDARAALVAAKAPDFALPTPLFANLNMHMNENGSGRRAFTNVEVIAGDDIESLEGDVYIYGHFEGDLKGTFACNTRGRGDCKITTKWIQGGQIFAAVVDGVALEDDLRLRRPVGFARIDQLAYRLASSLGSGLRADTVAYFLNDDGKRACHYCSGGGQSLPAVNLRTLGAGLASAPTAIVVEADYFFSSPLAEHYVVFSSFGANTPDSPLSWDPDFYAPDVLVDYEETPLVVRNHPHGTGLASSSITFGNLRVGFDYWLAPNLSPSIGYFSYGNGLASSSIILDTSMWNLSLSRSWTSLVSWQPTSSLGTGLASSSFLLPYSAGTLSWLGFNSQQLSFYGTGLASSSFTNTYFASRYSFTLTQMSTLNFYGMSFEATGAEARELDD